MQSITMLFQGREMPGNAAAPASASGTDRITDSRFADILQRQSVPPESTVFAGSGSTTPLSPDMPPGLLLDPEATSETLLPDLTGGIEGGLALQPPSGNGLPLEGDSLPPSIAVAVPAARHRDVPEEHSLDVNEGSEDGEQPLLALLSSADEDADGHTPPRDEAEQEAVIMPGLRTAESEPRALPGKPQASLVSDPAARRESSAAPWRDGLSLRDVVQTGRPEPAAAAGQTLFMRTPQAPLVLPQGPAEAALQAEELARDTPRTEQIVARPGDVAAGSRFASVLSRAEAEPAVQVPVGRNGWAEALGQRMLWMGARGGVGQAELALNPPELGPLHVRINTQNDQASVVFSSAHIGVREALDQALPRLREMFDGQGLQLVDVDVRDQPRQGQQWAQARAEGRPGGARDGYAGDEPGVTDTAQPRTRLGLVDDYV